MRVSPCGLIAVTLNEAFKLAKASAEVAHNHPERIKGAQATAAAIFWPRQEPFQKFCCRKDMNIMKMQNNTIIKLDGPDRVRKRPGVIFGSDGSEGVMCAIKMLMDVFIAEAALGYCHNISVTVHRDNSISVRNYDRGFIIDETVVEGKPIWHYDFCEIYSSVRESDKYSFSGLGSTHSDLYGDDPSISPKYQIETESISGLCCVQYASAFMNVEATRDGIKKRLKFKKGHSVSEAIITKSSEQSSTYIHFKLDEEVFVNAEVDFNKLEDFLRETAVAIAGLRIDLIDERNGKSVSYIYPQGLLSYAESISGNLAATPFYFNEIEAVGKDRYNKREYSAKVGIVFGFVKNSPKIECFHNYRILEYGGRHLRAVEKCITNSLNNDFLDELIDKGITNPHEKIEARSEKAFCFDDLSNHIILLIESNCSRYATAWGNGTRKFITNTMLTDIACDLIDNKFNNYLKENHKSILEILNQIMVSKTKGISGGI